MEVKGEKCLAVRRSQGILVFSMVLIVSVVLLLIFTIFTIFGYFHNHNNMDIPEKSPLSANQVVSLHRKSIK